MEKKCVACGACFDVCKHEAREYKDDTERFFDDLKKGEKISILLAPAFKANYPKEYESVLGGLKYGSKPYNKCFFWSGYYHMGIFKLYKKE